MRYYVVSDVHGYFSALKAALSESGFFEDREPHKLILCGDLFDRGGEALLLQELVLSLLARDEVILIRGNHEDLMLRLLGDWKKSSYFQSHHLSNKTVDTVLQLTGFSKMDLYYDADRVGKALYETPFMQKILPHMRDYFETENFIFVHGWIPCRAYRQASRAMSYSPVMGWRNAGEEDWNEARWINGMEAARAGVTVAGKTIVCGHWHASFGHANYEGRGGEFEDHPDFSPYFGEGIIAIDACTTFTGKVNCLIVEDEELK